MEDGYADVVVVAQATQIRQYIYLGGQQGLGDSELEPLLPVRSDAAVWLFGIQRRRRRRRWILRCYRRELWWCHAYLFFRRIRRRYWRSFGFLQLPAPNGATSFGTFCSERWRCKWRWFCRLSPCGFAIKQRRRGAAYLYFGAGTDKSAIASSVLSLYITHPPRRRLKAGLVAPG